MGRVSNSIQRIFGVFLIVVGLNRMIGFFPLPAYTGEAQQFYQALINSGYIMPTVALVQVLTGALLAGNTFVRTAIVVLAPITLNILLFHLFLDIASIAPALVITSIHVYLLLMRRREYASLLSAS